MWQAHLFDGRVARACEVVVSIHDGMLRIHAGERVDELVVPFSSLSIGEKFAGAPWMIGLPGGSTLQLEDDPARRFGDAIGLARGGVVRLINSTRLALLCAACLIALVFWLNRQGIPWAAETLLNVVPLTVDERIGRSELALLDASQFVPSRVSVERRAHLRERFIGLVRQYDGTRSCDLQFRSTRGGSPGDVNAIALPGCTIVLLDGLTARLTDDQLLAVLGHEFGHVVYRHPMRKMVQSMGFLTVAAVMWGDVSTVAAASVGSLEGLPYSRRFESESDNFAVDFARRTGLPPQAMSEALQALGQVVASRGEPPLLLSDHPSLTQRMESVRKRSATGSQE